MKDGLVRLSAFSPTLSAAQLAAVQLRQRAIESGRFQPFSGRLLDNAGVQRLAQGALSDAQIASMDWLVQGVSGSLSSPR
jgi:basic membrane protein A and related proteins